MRPPLRRWLVGALMSALLLVVFTLYLQPEFMRSMADMVWACF